MSPAQRKIRRLRNRKRVSTSDLEELYYLVTDMKEDIAEELAEAKKKEDEKKKEKKEGFWEKKFTFGQMMLGSLLIGTMISWFTVGALLMK